MSKNYIYTFLGLLILSLAACQPRSQEEKETSQESKKELKTGLWRAVLMLGEEEAPFQFELKNSQDSESGWVAHLINGEERLQVDEIRKTADSLIITLHIFDAVLASKIINDTLLEGKWIKYGYEKPYEVPFRAEFGKKYRFEPAKNLSKSDFSGKWEVTFQGSSGDTYPAIAVFEQQGERITGTFLTNTGDYRFLDGNIADDTLQLTAFDGSHGFLFKAYLQGDSLKGTFWPGISPQETFRGTRNQDAQLANPDKLTYLKEGYTGIEFAFPNANGDTLRFPSEEYKGKVVMIQIMGTWCPNCMDETNFYLPFYQKNHQKGLEIIALAYERSPDFTQAAKRVKKMTSRYEMPYEVLIAGINDKTEAAKTLPMLNKIVSYPTTIFIDRKGKVRKIHTGFTGPGTGIYYERFTNEFYQFMEKLLNEAP